MKNPPVKISNIGRTGDKTPMIFKNKDYIEILKKSSVGIAGVGGLGSNAAVSLARVGVGKLVLVDFDRVEKSNLDRQFFFNDQIGMLKVEALKDTIHRIKPKVKVEVHPKKLKNGSMHLLFQDVDVIIEALDEAKTKTKFIEEISLKLPDKPLVSASGVAGIGGIDRIQCKEMGMLYMVYDEEAKSSKQVPLIAPRVALIGNWEASLAVEILLGGKK